MIIGFDPVSQTVTLEFENGQPPVELPVERLIANYYASNGILAATMTDGDLELSFIPTQGEPTLAWLVSAGRQQWLVHIRVWS